MLIWSSAAKAGLPDPTKPPQALAAPAAGNDRSRVEHTLKLTSTVISARRRVATINGKVLTVGQEIEGAIVLAIAPQSVKLRYQEKVISIPLISERIKTPARVERVENITK